MVGAAAVAVVVAGLALFGPVATASTRSPGGTVTAGSSSYPFGVQTTEQQVPDGGSDTTGGTDAATESSAVNDLFNAMETSRSNLATALGEVDTCTALTDAATAIQQVADDRSTQLQQARALAVDQLANGADLQSALESALTYSQQADQSYASWATAVSQGDCQGTPPTTTDQQAGNSASENATTYKATAVADWNQIAGTYGYSTVDADQV
jgi:DnaJ-class molecular chaperone